MFHRLLLLTFLSASPFFALMCFSQADTLRHSRLNVKFSPQHLLIGGIHLDIEKSMDRHARHSLIFSPHVYSGDTWYIDAFTERENETEDMAKVLGFGGEIQHRIYTAKIVNSPSAKSYVAYGFSYHQFEIGFSQQGWIEEVASDGLLYYTYKPLPYTEKINRWGALVMIGLQGPVMLERLIGDIYLGLGYKSSSNNTSYSFPRYNMSMSDYGYTGVHFLAGIKLGLAL